MELGADSSTGSRTSRLGRGTVLLVFFIVQQYYFSSSYLRLKIESGIRSAALRSLEPSRLMLRPGKSGAECRGNEARLEVTYGTLVGNGSVLAADRP